MGRHQRLCLPCLVQTDPEKRKSLPYSFCLRRTACWAFLNHLFRQGFFFVGADLRYDCTLVSCCTTRCCADGGAAYIFLALRGVLFTPVSIAQTIGEFLLRHGALRVGFQICCLFRAGNGRRPRADGRGRQVPRYYARAA